MFFLWLGMMVGFSLTYLHHGEDGRSRRTAVWATTVAILSILCLTSLYEFLLEATGPFGFREAVKVVFVPFIAGLGFGYWLYRVVVAEDGTPIGPLPLFLCILFASLIVSEERYGWFARIEKISVAGGGIEFSAQSGRSAERPVATTPSAASVELGESKVAKLLRFMRDLHGHIKEDIGFHQEVFPGPGSGSAQASPSIDEQLEQDPIYGDDYRFAFHVAEPLGLLLKRTHDTRRYNSLDFITDRDFVDNFRAFVGASPDQRANTNGARGSVAKIIDGLATIWRKACKIATDGDNGGVHPVKLDAASYCRDDALLEKHLARNLTSKTFRPSLPYGAILSALLLDAAGETQAALWQIDQWNQASLPKAREPDPSRLIFPRYRATTHAASLGLPGSSAAMQRLAIERLHDSIDFGEMILSREPWIDHTTKIYLKNGVSDAVPPTRCLTSTNFKRFALVHFSYVNTYLYYVSQKPDLLEEEDKTRSFKTRLVQLEKLNLHCLRVRNDLDDRLNSIRTEAAFRDTIATVQSALAARADGASARRALLCTARDNAAEATSLQDKYVSTGQRDPTPPTWDVRIGRAYSKETRTDYDNRAKRIERLLKADRYDCP